jgi:hypothetical protein
VTEKKEVVKLASLMELFLVVPSIVGFGVGRTSVWMVERHECLWIWARYWNSNPSCAKAKAIGSQAKHEAIRSSPYFC